MQTVTKTIDGIRFEVTKFMGREGFKIKIKLLKLLGPALGMALGDVKDLSSGIKNLNITGESIAKAIKMLVETMDEDQFFSFAMRMLASTRIYAKMPDGSENIMNIDDSTFDIQFSGKYSTVYKLLAFIIETNYGNFFGEGGIGGIFNRVENPMPPSGKQTKDSIIH